MTGWLVRHHGSGWPLTIEELHCSPFNLLSDILASLQSRAIDKALRLSLKLSDRIPQTISTDPTRLRQIITNLVGNAVTFTSVGSVDLTVDTRRAEEQLLIHVSDTSVGIDSLALADVFKPFHQENDSVNCRFGDTVLRLSISHDLAAELGGDITVESEAGAGSTFTVTIATGPLDQDNMLSMTDARSAMQTSSVDQLPSVSLSGIRVLIADDVDANRELFAHTLRGAGAVCRTLDDGRAAIDAWRNESFDLMLMDMRMPGMDGYYAVRKLRAEGAELPILALTANGMPEDEECCHSVGCTGYPAKPISMKDLLQAAVVHIAPFTINAAAAAQTTSATVSQPKLRNPAELTTGSPAHPGNTTGEVVPADPTLREMALMFLKTIQGVNPDSLQAMRNQDANCLVEQGHCMRVTGRTVGLRGYRYSTGARDTRERLCSRCLTVRYRNFIPLCTVNNNESTAEASSEFLPVTPRQRRTS